MHSSGLSHAEIVEWWVKQWLTVADGGGWLMRIEDDVLLHPDAGERLAAWDEVAGRADFGVGILVPMRMTVADCLRQCTVRREPVGLSCVRRVSGGQAQLIHADVLRKALPGCRRHHAHSWPTSAFDTGLHGAIQRLGLRMYLGLPALGDHEVGTSAVRGTTNGDWALSVGVDEWQNLQAEVADDH